MILAPECIPLFRPPRGIIRDCIAEKVHFQLLARLVRALSFNRTMFLSNESHYGVNGRMNFIIFLLAVSKEQIRAERSLPSSAARACEIALSRLFCEIAFNFLQVILHYRCVNFLL